MSIYKLELKNYRRLKKFTQIQLAAELEISQSFLSELENGKYNMSIELLFKISLILEVCPHRLIGYNCVYNCVDRCNC